MSDEDDDWLRGELVNRFYDARAQMRQESLPDLVSISEFDFDPFIKRQLADGEVCYAVWVDRNQRREIGYVALKGRELDEDRSLVQVRKRTVMPFDSEATAKQIEAILSGGGYH